LRIENIDKNYKDKFIKEINDDLNIPNALAVAQDMLKSDIYDEIKFATILDFDKVLGLNLEDMAKDIDLPDDIKKLVSDRQKARDEKDYKESDRLRDEIETLGYLVEDTKDGQRVIKK
jgi:cysteinyl-tRNA synthetase